MSLLSRHIEIYEFKRGPATFCYTSADRTIVESGQTFDPYAIKRDRIFQSEEQGKAGLQITAPLSLPVLGLWRPFPPSERVAFRLRRIRKSDGVVTSAWMGVVSDVEEDQHTATIRCQSHLASLATNGLRRCWQIGCPHVLYGIGPGLCNVNQDDFRLDTSLTGIQGVTLESPDFADFIEGYFNGGFIRWTDGTQVEHRFITSHVEEHITVMTPSLLVPGTTIAAFPGCGHDLVSCHEKFGNALNYGGQHTIPVVNPFGQDPLF